MKLVQELGLPTLTTEQIEALCSVAENAARKYVLAKVPAKMVEQLNISVEADGAKPVNLTVEVYVELAPEMKGFNSEKLASEAVKEALKASENYLRKLT